MLNKFKGFFKKGDDTKTGIPITPDTATQLQMFCDEGIGQVLRIYYVTNETIYLVSTGGVFTIDAKLSTPPVFVGTLDNSPLAHFSVHSEKGFALVYGEGVCLWNEGVKREIVNKIDGFSARSVSWFNDGDKLLSGWAEEDSDWYGEGIARINDLQGELQWEQKNENGWITACACGKSHFAFGSATGDVSIYTNDYQIVCKLELDGLNPLPEILFFDEDILYIVAVDDNSEMRLLKWTHEAPDTLELLVEESVTGHNQTCISTDKRIAFITSEDTKTRKPNRLYVRSLDGSTEKSAVITGNVEAIAFSPDCKSLATIDESGIKTFSSANARMKAFGSLGSSSNCTEMTISKFSEYIANWGRGSGTNEIIFLSKEDGKEVSRLSVKGIGSVAFLPNGNLAVATTEGLLYVDAEKKVIQTSVTNDISRVFVMHDNQSLVLSGKSTNGHQLIIFNTVNGKTKYIPTTEGFIHKVIELVKNKLLLTFSVRKNADFYSVEKDRCIKRLSTSYVSVSPDENYFAWVEAVSCKKDKDILISKSIDGPISCVSLEPRLKHLLRSIQMDFSPDSKKLLVTGDTTAIIDIETMKITHEIELQGLVKWSPTGDIFVIGGAHPTNSELPFNSEKFIIFDCQGNNLAEYKVPRRVKDIQFAPDGSGIFVLCAYGGVFLFKNKSDVQ